MTFWERLARHNAPFIAKALRKLADEAERLYPGPPVWAYPVLFHTDKGARIMGEITVRDTDPDLNATVSFVDVHGHPTQPDDTPVWSSSDEAVATVEATADGLSATVQIQDTPGAAVIQVRSVDSDGTEVVAQGTVTVQSGEAAIGSVEFTPGA